MMSGKDKTFILIRKRASGFRLIQRRFRGSTTKTETIQDLRIDAINKLYLSEEITEKTARNRLKAVRNEIYRRAGKLPPPGDTDNLKVLDQFWRNYRKKHRRLTDPDSAKAKFRRAIELLGPINIVTATEEDLQDALDKKAKEKNWSDNNHQKMGGALRTILKFIGRPDVELFLNSKTKSEVDYLTEDEVKKLANSISDENLSSLVLSAFYTGMRIGELMFIKPASIKEDAVNVKKQLKRDGTTANTKTGIERKAYIIPKGLPYVQKWAASSKKLPMKQENTSHYIRAKSERVLGKSIKFHDLRHSYAVHMVSKGAPLELVAQSMGNSVKVCERYYSGYQLTTMGIETLKKILGQ